VTNSEIKTGIGGTVFAGPDAVKLFQAMTIVSGLRLYAKHRIQPSRGYTPSAMLKAASGFTGKAYKRGAYQQAADDLKLWADTMAAALPVTKS